MFTVCAGKSLSSFTFDRRLPSVVIFSLFVFQFILFFQELFEKQAFLTAGLRPELTIKTVL